MWYDGIGGRRIATAVGSGAGPLSLAGLRFDAGGEATSVLARTASGDFQPSASLAAWVAAEIEIRRGDDLHRPVLGGRLGRGRRCGRRHRRNDSGSRGGRRCRGVGSGGGRRQVGLGGARWRGERLKLIGVDHAALHLTLRAQGRPVLDETGDVHDPGAQRAQQRPEVLLAAVAQQRGAGFEIEVRVVRQHLKMLVGLQSLRRPAIHPAGVRLPGEQIFAAQMSLHRNHGPLFLGGQRSRRDCSPSRDHRRLLDRRRIGVGDLLRLFSGDHVPGRQLPEHVVLHPCVAGVALLVRQPPPHVVEAGEDPERLEEAIRAGVRVGAARTEASVRQIDQIGTQRLRLPRLLRKDVRQPFVREIDHRQAVVARRSRASSVRRRGPPRRP